MINEQLKKYPIICVEGTNCVGKGYFINTLFKENHRLLYKTFRSSWSNMESPKGKASRRLADLDMTQAPNLVMDLLLQFHKEGHRFNKQIIIDRGFLSSWSYIMYKSKYLEKPKRLTNYFEDRLKLFDKQIMEISGVQVMLVASESVLEKHWEERIRTDEFTSSKLQMFSIQKFMLELIEKHSLESFIFLEVLSDGSYKRISLDKAKKISKFNCYNKKIVSKKFKTYIAGPFFNPEQKEIIKVVEDLTSRENLHSFSPSRDSIVISATTSKSELRKVFDSNWIAIDDSDLVIAVLDYAGAELFFEKNGSKNIVSIPDSGTIWELGYAFARNKPIIGYFTKPPQKVNLMLSEGIDAFCVGNSNFSKVIDEIKALIIDQRSGYDTTIRKEEIKKKYFIKTEVH